MRLAIVGVSGLVGRTIIKVLEELSIDVETLYPVASSSSVGKMIDFKGNSHEIISISECLSVKPDIVIFSAGKTVSLEWAKRFANEGVYVIDNSSAWRMQDDVKLIVPEVNITNLTKNDYLISNPNCSTIQLVVALYPLHKSYSLKRIIVSTYQSVSGSGIQGINQLSDERKGNMSAQPIYPHRIDLNCIPQGGAFTDNSYSEEEMKLVNESRKIMNIPSLGVSATVVRVPVIGGHSESVYAEFQSEPEIDEVYNILNNSQGISVIDDIHNNIYPMPITSENHNEVFVGRIRKDLFCKYSINLWICADNLRKGAATNAVQIADFVYRTFIR